MCSNWLSGQAVVQLSQIVVPSFAAVYAVGQAVGVYCVTLVILLLLWPLIAA
jgi:hypothetical protein